MRDSTFQSNTAEIGAGLSLVHSSMVSCIYGQLYAKITNCRFLENSVAREGGALYFEVFPMTHVSVKQSVFQMDQALPGAGFYRQNIDFPTCGTPTFELKVEPSITTHISQCQFIDNINTAVFVKSKQKYGILAITKTSFRNNWCMHSSYASEIFAEIDLKLHNIKISNEKNQQNVIGINSQSNANLTDVSVNAIGLSHHRQMTIATFSHLLTQTNSSSLKYQCPTFYQPVLSTAGLTDTGAAIIKISCDACFEGYYKGLKWLAISSQSDDDYHCQEKHIVDQNGFAAGKNKFCYTKRIGTCIECPHGANCTAGVIALPNYWGHTIAGHMLEFLRCPEGYCCNQAPCEGIDHCASNREGTLCGRCMKGFTESLITSQCISDHACSDWWIIPLFSLWTFTIALIIVFGQDIVQISKTCWNHMKSRISREQTIAKSNDTNKEGELNSRDDIEIEFTEVSPSSSEHSEIILDTMHSIVTQTSNLKVPILWGALTMQREDKVESPGSHKYLQIMFYYLQDAALLQVDLALASTIITPIQKLRQLLLNVSQLAVDLIDLGLNLCPIPGWTPVTKLLTKNLTGLFVFGYIFAMYGVVTVVCKFFRSKENFLKAYWYPRLTVAAIFSILLFYLQIANVAFSLQHCIKSGDHLILLMDGTVSCGQQWQILVFFSTLNWVIGITGVLMFLPGLLELRLIGVSQFFLSCLMPIPMLIYWLIKFYKDQMKPPISEDKVPAWHDEALRILQKTFVKTTDNKGLPICWIGFMKVRRMVLIITYIFVRNLVASISLMCLTIMLFMLFHLETKPYQDDLANKLYTTSLLATLAIGFINIMKAACVEFYLDLDNVAHFLTTLNLITDSILVYCPIGFVVLTIIGTAISKVRQIIKSKRMKSEKQS